MHTMTKSLSALFALSLTAVAGCSAEVTEEPTQVVESAKIIGTNDLVPVKENGANIPAKYRPLIDAFGRISMGCTATHIGNGVVLSAGHCFNAPSTRKNNFSCAGKTVAWGYRVDSPAYLTTNCTIVYAAQQSRDIDYAIFQVDVAPPVQVEVDYAARPALDSAITIFSHPRSRPLEWSQTCVVKTGATGGWGSNMLSHQCDTDPGSSGATVIDDVTLKVVGIHDGGLVPWNYASYVSDTPLAEILASLAAPPPAASGGDEEGELETTIDE
ncbi:MAG: trypsin-like peptidase domain-containing protein [Labilithrix sp.]|nr:trypsin-like peptidase domain-containing protein [Labilithrix sp.]MCW5813642.1 trypsin-like peptidase domain-containing protein [Labilithrix sp.]